MQWRTDCTTLSYSMTFDQLDIIKPLLSALVDAGYTQPTAIQEKAIPHVLAGRDIFGCAQTGTGKTAAFALPILQHLSASEPATPQRSIKALILAPTRELATQIAENITMYSKNLSLRHTVVFGGVSQFHQVKALRRGVDILVATPGRLLDLMEQGIVRLNELEYLVLDEADRMLDMGFIVPIKKIITKIPAKRQTLFFSATMPPEIRHLVNQILKNPIHIDVNVANSSLTPTLVKQSVYYVEKENKRRLLQHILDEHEIDSALVFTRTKRGADRVVKDLNRGGIRAEAIHGDKSQMAREKALKSFKDKTLRVLVATDIASRGIDIDKLSHVINFEIPEAPETYVHRIGRTGRAGSPGIALSFCTLDELPYMRGIDKLVKTKIEVVTEHPYEYS